MSEGKHWTWDEAERAQRLRRLRELAALVQPRPAIAQRLRALCARALKINFKRTTVDRV